jgi:hypothetical protein
MSAQRILVMGLLILAAWGIGRATSPASSEVPHGLFPTAAQAQDFAWGVSAGETFISTDGGNAYLWLRWEDRIVLLGACTTVEGPAGQASYVWSPGVERGS